MKVIEIPNHMGYGTLRDRILGPDPIGLCGHCKSTIYEDQKHELGEDAKTQYCDLYCRYVEEAKEEAK